MQETSDRLTHLVYEASLDNSLWPELVLELTEQLQSAGRRDQIAEESGFDLTKIAEHFRRAFAISEKVVGLQERASYMSAVLDTFSFGLALFDDGGRVILQNRTMQDILTPTAVGAEGLNLIFSQPNGAERDTLPVVRWVEACNRHEAPVALRISSASSSEFLMLPRREAVRMGFPAKAAAVLLTTDKDGGDSLRSFAVMHGLTPRESDLARALYRLGDLRLASDDIGLSYESARTYLKRIYEKSGCSSQADLITSIARLPMALLRAREKTGDEVHKVRRTITLRDGRTLEYFTLGPEDGKPVVHFDALAGITIDIAGYPGRCLPYLERYGVRLITPCRPGAFRSTPNPMTSLRDFAPDVAELLNALNIERFAIVSASYGSGTALAVTHSLITRVERVVLSSAAYPEYRHNNWRELDLFYQLSVMLGRKWPAMLRQMIPFLVRSIMQNPDRFFDRTCKKIKSDHDIAILTHPTMRRRTVESLAERTANGVDGMVEENLLNAQGWDFDVAEIDVPVDLVHGTLDNVTPLAGAELLCQRLPNARLIRFDGMGHYHDMLTWPTLVALAAGRKVESFDDMYELAN